MKSKFFSILLISLTLLSFFVGCQKQEERSLFAMDTLIKLQCSGKHAEEALTACEAEIHRLESLLSATRKNSDITKLNTAEGTDTVVDETTAALINTALQLGKQLDGAFDITVRPFVELWGFPNAEQRVPTQEEINALFPLINANAITIDGNTIHMPADTKIDLGGIAKGYCGEQLRNILKSYGIESAILTLGGNIEAIGTKPDGSPWRVAIQDPKNTAQVIGVVEVIDRAIVTAGSYQRYFEQDGKIYHHILDPKTGYPADSGLCSVTVIAKSGTFADACSTAFFVLGIEQSLSLLETDAFSDCAAVFVQNDGTVVCSDGVSLLQP